MRPIPLLFAVACAPAVLDPEAADPLAAERLYPTPTGAVLLDAVFLDLNGDPTLDVVTLSDDAVVAWLGDPSGAFALAQEVYATEGGLTSVAAGDLDGDGDPDLVVGAHEESDVSGAVGLVFLNQAGLLVDGGSFGYQATMDVALADADGDGDLDVARAGRVSTEKWVVYDPLHVHLNDGSGDLSTVAFDAGTSDDATSVAWGDLEPDGDLDLAVGAAGTTRIWTWDGATWVEVPGLVGGGTRAVAWVDADLDGDLDLLRLGQNQALELWTNTGGTFAETWASANDACVGAVFDFVWCEIAVGDVDLDGDPDLRVAGHGEYSTFQNVGGAFVRRIHRASDVRAVDLGDWDGDGDLDTLRAGVDGFALVENPTL